MPCSGFSLRWLLLLQSNRALVREGFRNCGSQSLEPVLISCGTRAEQYHSMWDLLGPGIEPVSPVLAGGFFTVEPTREAQRCLFSTEKLTSLYKAQWICVWCVWCVLRGLFAEALNHTYPLHHTEDQLLPSRISADYLGSSWIPGSPIFHVPLSLFHPPLVNCLRSFQTVTLRRQRHYRRI